MILLGGPLHNLPRRHPSHQIPIVLITMGVPCPLLNKCSMDIIVLKCGQHFHQEDPRDALLFTSRPKCCFLLVFILTILFVINFTQANVLSPLWLLLLGRP